MDAGWRDGGSRWCETDFKPSLCTCKWARRAMQSVSFRIQMAHRTSQGPVCTVQAPFCNV